MFLSKVNLNLRNRRSYRLISDLYAQHQFVMSAFPDGGEAEHHGEGAQARLGVLYRLESTKQKNEMFFLVQSHGTPDWAKPQQLHADVICAALTQEIKVDFQQGSTYRFRLRANPTVCKVNRDQDGVRMRPKRDPIFGDEDQRDWLARTGVRCGFEVAPHAILITQLGKLGGVKPAGTTNQMSSRLTCYMADFDGTLVVNDVASFRDSLREGIGRGKAWGCGLLSLARA